MMIIEAAHLIDLSIKLMGGLETRELVAYCTNVESVNLLRALHSRNWLRRSSLTDLSSAQAKQFGFLATFDPAPEECQRRLSCATVAILGLGGIGSVVLQHLVGAGVKRYILIDYDKVERSNFNRQFIYTEADIGCPKVEVAARYIAQRVPESVVRVFDMQIRSRSDLALINQSVKIDLFVLAADRPLRTIEDEAASFCDAVGVPLLTAGAGVRGGFAGPVSSSLDGSDHRGKQDFLQQWRSELSRRIPVGLEAFDQPSPWSYGPTNTVAGTLAADLAIRHLAGLHSPEQVRHEFELGPFRHREFRAETRLPPQ